MQLLITNYKLQTKGTKDGSRSPSILTLALILLLFCTNSFAYELAALESETAEDLLLFFEEEELIIATKHKTPLRKAPAIATVITAKDIRNMGARNLMDILKRVPGIGVSTAEVPAFHAVEVRGIRTLYSDKLLIMVDGHRINESMHGSSMHFFAYMSVDSIKRVEIIRGPGSALYGANAFLSVINIITKNTDDIKGVQVTAGTGSFDTQHYNLLFGHKGEKIKISGFVDYYDTNGQSLFIEQDAAGNSGDTLEWQERPDIGLNIEYGDFTLRSRYIRNEMGPIIGAASALNDETVQDWGQYYTDLTYKKDISDRVNITSRLYYDQVRLNPYWELFSEGFRGVYPDGMLGNPESKHRKLGGEFTTDFSVDDHRLTAGVMYEHIKQYDVHSFGNFHSITFAPQTHGEKDSFNRDVKRKIWALYVQDVWDIQDTLSLTTGVRYDNYSDFGDTTNPRAGLVWEFMENTSLKLLYGSAFRAPSFAQLYHINNPSIIGNPNLNPEKIKTYEAGLEHRFLQRYTARLSYFYNDIEDLIASGDKPSATEPAVQQNKGSAEIDGIEAELLFDLGNDNYGFFNYSYQHPIDGDTGQRLPDVPAHRANAMLNLAPWKYLNANINVSWTGKRYRDDRDTRSDLPDETMIDLTLIAKNFYKTLEIRGSIYNLLDNYYQDPSPHPGSVPNDFPTNKRMFMVEARYTF